MKAGRCSHLPPKGLPEEELAGAIEELELKDPSCERYREIEAHTKFGGEEGQPSWISRVVGDMQQYTDGGEGETISYAVNVLKSLRWPGAYTVSKGGMYTSIYVGHGLKKGDPSYNPIEPPMVCVDPEEEEEKPEPNPLTEPPVQNEEDTMAENKDDDEEDE